MRKTTDSIKIHSGTDQPCRMSGPDVMRIAPSEGGHPAPAWFNTTQAVAEWDRLVPILQNVKVLTEADLGALALLCALSGDIVKQWEVGNTPNAALLRGLWSMYGDFGLTPVGRMKVSVSPDGKEANSFKKQARGE